MENLALGIVEKIIENPASFQLIDSLTSPDYLQLQESLSRRFPSKSSCCTQSFIECSSIQGNPVSIQKQKRDICIY